MKVVILAGGLGTRLSEYTESIPKPMVAINDSPIIEYIIRHYIDYGHDDFYIACGYKGHVLKKHFSDLATFKPDIRVTSNRTGHEVCSLRELPNFSATLIDTGQSTMTGGRLLRLKDQIGSEPFLLTYGDGLSDINISKLITQHQSSGAICTLTAVRPPARFGKLEISGNRVDCFKEKPQLSEGWINGGFMICEPQIFDHIDDDSSVLESDVFTKIASLGLLEAYFHDGFWQCMDTKRDRDLLAKQVSIHKLTAL